MKLKLSALLFIALFPLLSFAQGSALTIFSEDGDKFILYLNGVQQNNASQVNLRMEGLTQQFYKAKIVFDDKSKAPIEKSVPVTNPGTTEPADIVYKIKNKDGEMKLRYFSAQPVQPNYTPPADVHTVHYGQPDQVTTTTTQTTVTTTGANTGNGGVSIGTNLGNGGVSFNMNVNDPNINSTVTQTTSTQTTTSSSSSYSDNMQPATTGNVCQYPMDGNSFNSAKQTISQASFEDTKLSTAQSILASNCVSTDQVVVLCNLFTFEDNKLKFAKLAYAKTTDKANYFKVANAFTFDASKNELNNFIANGGR